jgi:hypothetical protein
MGFGLCHRCGKWAVENLRAHSFCWECNYAPENDVTVMPWTSLEFRNSKIAALRRQEENKIYFDESNDFSRNEVGGA